MDTGRRGLSIQVHVFSSRLHMQHIGPFFQWAFRTFVLSLAVDNILKSRLELYLILQRP